MPCPAATSAEGRSDSLITRIASNSNTLVWVLLSFLVLDNCIIRGEANFHSVETPSLDLRGSVFSGHAVFTAMQTAYINLADVKFNQSADFTGADLGVVNDTRLRSSKPIEIRWDQFGAASLADSLSWAKSMETPEEQLSGISQTQERLHFWKRNFSSLGYQKDAAEVNYEIINLKTQYFFKPSQFDWWAAKITGLPSRYGTRPYRPLWAGLILVLVFAGIYFAADPFTPRSDNARIPKKPLAMFSLLYSVDTFLPFFEITGVTEWGWQIENQYRWVVMLERLTGFAIGGLAAYSIGSFVL